MRIKPIKLHNITGYIQYPKKKENNHLIVISDKYGNQPVLESPEDVLKLSLWLIRAANELKKIRDAKSN